MRPDSSLPLLLWAWAQWFITLGEDWVSLTHGGAGWGESLLIQRIILIGKGSQNTKIQRTLGFRLFITNVNGTIFGMSESLEASTRRWSSNHVPYDSTYKPKKNINNI
jgi:hypothetical protein